MSKRITPEEVIVDYFSTGATTIEVRVMFGVIKGLIKKNHASLLMSRKATKVKAKVAKATGTQTSFETAEMERAQ